MEPASSDKTLPRLCRLALAAFRRAETRCKHLMHCIELSKVQLELQQAIAAINSYHHHLGELVSLRHQNRDLLSSQPETSQRIDLVIGRALAVIQRSEEVLKRCSLVEVEGESPTVRKLRWRLRDKRSFTRCRTEAELNDIAVAAHISELRHLALADPVNELLSASRMPQSVSGGGEEEAEELLLLTPSFEKKGESSKAVCNGALKITPSRPDREPTPDILFPPPAPFATLPRINGAYELRQLSRPLSYPVSASTSMSGKQREAPPPGQPSPTIPPLASLQRSEGETLKQPAVRIGAETKTGTGTETGTGAATAAGPDDSGLVADSANTEATPVFSFGKETKSVMA